MAKGKYEYWLTEEGLLKIGAWARDGLTLSDIAHNMGVSRDTLNTWCKKYSDISDTIKKTKEVADIRVENALFTKATGIKMTVKKPIKLKKTSYKDGKKVKEEEYIEYADEEVYIPPDTTAQIFWLKNRKPDVWKDKQNMVISGVDEDKSMLNDIINSLTGGDS